MPYFSFILDKKNLISSDKAFSKFKLQIKYYSKNTKLWSKLNKISKFTNTIKLQKEKREKFIQGSKSILFCLPPSIGLGDAVEYALGIKSIINSFKFNKVGIAHVGKYINIFKDEFNFSNVYDIISEKDVNLFETTFHFTLEIDDLIFQKYDRQNIEKLIVKYFNVPLYRRTFQNKKNISDKKKISIFPVSNSPLRSLPIYILKEIINDNINKFDIEIFLSKESEVSDYIFEKLKHYNKIRFKNPINLDQLIYEVKNINFGVFCDSGPLHLAKIYNKYGLLIISSVDEKILLDKFLTIKAIKSSYISDYCYGPCGLVNVFEFNKKCGCYDNIKIQKKLIMSKKNLNSLQRGDAKKNYLDLYINSFNCYKEHNIKKINLLIQNNI